MEKKLDKLEEKVDKLDVRLDHIDKLLDRNTLSLEIHMKRTATLEQYVQKEIGPVKAHVALVSLGFKGIVWFTSAIAGIAGFVYLMKQLNVF